MYMMSVDFATFIVVNIVILTMKQIDPNKFFLIYGIKVFLPPEEKELTDLRKENE